MPETTHMLWIDCETTGLLVDPDVPTILETSWTVTDTAGVQLTPLNQRFTMLPAAQSEDDVDDWRACAPLPMSWSDTPENAEITWQLEGSPAPGNLSTDYPVEFVRAMHAGNGLVEEYGRYAAGLSDADGLPERELPAHDRNLILSWAQHDSLLVRDLTAAGAHTGETGQLCLAGGGVSHYEDRFLRYTCPDTFGMTAMHYSTGADVSTVLRALAIRLSHLRGGARGDRFPNLGKADYALALARTLSPTALPDGWDHIELATGTDYASADRDVRAWAYAEADSHRAAPGIARALMAYRCLPAVLTEVLDVYGQVADLARVATLGSSE